MPRNDMNLVTFRFIEIYGVEKGAFITMQPTKKRRVHTEEPSKLGSTGADPANADMLEADQPVQLEDPTEAAAKTFKDLVLHTEPLLIG